MDVRGMDESETIEAGVEGWKHDEHGRGRAERGPTRPDPGHRGREESGSILLMRMERGEEEQRTVSFQFRFVFVFVEGGVERERGRERRGGAFSDLRPLSRDL